MKLENDDDDKVFWERLGPYTDWAVAVIKRWSWRLCAVLNEQTMLLVTEQTEARNKWSLSNADELH